jgi:dTDP-4-amino-4,6-dideoxygalactose transaminase
MDGIQGAVLNVKLAYLDEWNRQRRAIAGRYDAGLKEIDGLKIPRPAEYAGHVYHLYVIETVARDELVKSLKREGVDTAVQYPHPIHLTEAYDFLGYKEGDLPVCEGASKRILSLPLFPDMLDDQVDFVLIRFAHSMYRKQQAII